MFKYWSLAMITCITFPRRHIYVCKCTGICALPAVREPTDWGPAIEMAFCVASRAMNRCTARALCVWRRHQKWPGRGCHLTLPTSCLLLLSLYNTPGAGHTLDTFSLNPELYDPRLSMDTLHVLSVFCMCDIAIVRGIGVSVCVQVCVGVRVWVWVW